MIFFQSVHKGLMDLLNYQGDDMEEVFVQPFQISYTDLFDQVRHSVDCGYLG